MFKKNITIQQNDYLFGFKASKNLGSPKTLFGPNEIGD